ncbi:virulence-associated E family protein [Runella salmonicolor]|uniref:Virulence-associated E family protein n=1 Tax=Runella salmonicolor TaxID=2950278 RepID=A0ABT1FQL2_9BACT|nr:virulence-associated E family protein [Runella salmonicolor]MCP1384049.1 virulence-associated E family protein [Runella salmonicolor]
MDKGTQKFDNQKVNTRKALKIDEIEGHLLGNYDIRINVITNTIEKRAKDTKDSFEPINENDLKYELLKNGYTRFDGELKAILGSSIIQKYDPFKEYFEGLDKWDSSQPDYIKQLSTFIKTDDQYWFEIMFKKMLVRVVSQALGNNQFNKHCFTFVGKQHDGKTSFFDFLVPPALKTYYKKGYDFHGGRQSKFSLVQNFLVNLDELAQFDKRDLNNEFKATLSESTVKYAPLFSSTEVLFFRRASFVASTNHFDFLTDETGSVRWIIFNVLKINHDNGGKDGYSQIDINRVWAQAYALLKDGFKGELSYDEINQMELLNRRFMRVTAEMELIAKHFKSAESTSIDASFYTATTLEKNLRERGYKVTHIQIGRALKMLGFQQTQKYNSQLKYQDKGYWLQES